jgi:hypothetical protein
MGPMAGCSEHHSKPPGCVKGSEFLDWLSVVFSETLPPDVKRFPKRVKVVPLHSIEVLLGERRYSSYSFLTSALEGGEWSASRPICALWPGKETPVPIV